MSSIIYSLVANDASSTPLAEVSLAEGNFSLMALKLLKRVKKEASISYSYQNQYMFHCHNSGGITYLCMTDADFSNRTAYTFLFDIKEKFQQRYGEEAKRAVGLGANRDFSEVMKGRMLYYNTDPGADKLKVARQNLDRTKDIMIENIDKVLARGEKIELLVKKTEHMSDSAVTMRRTATKVKRHMWWKNFKITLIVIAVILVIVFFIIVLVCGGFDFENCS
mmetsp:Transcript_2932/g.4554  ORF Transcript_2932/g.4554 Transcript_2932/m.4554 type:complete len:222 (+) Transcript_2932:22-687(+)